MRKILLSLFLMAFFMQAIAQQTITGVVTDKNDGVPVPGATITVKGTQIAAMTDLEGKFKLSAPEDAILIVSFLGYLTQEITLNGQSEINVQLVVDDLSLDEVVVVGYGTQKKSLVTGAISKVDSKDLVKGSNLRVNQAIQGKTAGVLVQNNSGQPGSFVSVRIRGIGTNNENEPLYIVDGLPGNGNSIDYLNASDIESVEVLKDAASSAIYGARGANGVIIITTKSGKKDDKFEISYDGSMGYQNPWRKLSVLDSKRYLEIINEAAANSNANAAFDPAYVNTIGANTDWQDLMFNKNALKSNHVLSFSGGNKTTSYSSSLSYFSQEGIVAKGNSQFERYTFRLNVDKEMGILTLGTNITLANIDTKGIDANDKYGTSLAQAINMPSIIPVKFENGKYATPSDFGIGMQEITNPVALLSIRNNASTTQKAIAGVSANFDMGKLFGSLKGLSFKTSYSTEYAFVNYRSYSPIYNFSATKYNVTDDVQSNFDKYVRWNWDNLITYDKKFGKSHINLILGTSAFKEWSTNVGGVKSSLIFNSFDNAFLSNATDDESAITWGGFSEHTILSQFGRINYNFDEKYVLSATVRRDGSSRFGDENKFGIFPSVSAGWIMSNESFFPQSGLLNFAKLRASWGQNGNEAIGDFAYTTTMNSGNIYYFGVNPLQYNGVQPSRIPNPGLKWETSEQIDIALDLGLLNNKITMVLDYYSKKTKDWLVTAPAPLILGNNAPIVNGGVIKNSGFEFELSHRNKLGDFTYNVKVTGAFNKNEVLEINNAEKILRGGTGGFGQEQILRASIGKPMGYFWGYQVDGVFQTMDEVNAYLHTDGSKIQSNAQPGDFRFKDVNGDGKLTDDDRVMLGNPTPDFTGGLSIDLSYKGFDFSMFWYTAVGHQVWMALRRYDQVYTNYTNDFYENRWTGKGTSNTYPRVTLVDTNDNLKRPSDFYVKDADFMRLKNISLGYTLPASLSQKLKINRIRLYVAGENMLTFTKYPGFEPEIGGGVFGQGIDTGVYPQARTITGGINITF
jgi:TonB-dependent starch-binding outer membrane protein SusC